MDSNTERGTTDGESDANDITRRRVLRSTGAAAVGGITFVGVADATGGKGISWVAFCGCTDGFCIKWRVYDDEGELIKLGYEGDCTVYYKAGRNIYRHETTRTNSTDLSWVNSDGTVKHPVIETFHAGDGDPVASTDSSDSRDPCWRIMGSDGPKLEAAEIESYEYDCSDGGTTTESEDEEEEEEEEERRTAQHGSRPRHGHRPAVRSTGERSFTSTAVGPGL